MPTMFDAVDASALPDGGDLYAGYLNGNYRSWQAISARFPNAIVLGVDVTGGLHRADVLDVERGDAPPDAVGLWLDQVHPIVTPIPVVYCSRSAWPACASSAGARPVRWWVADWTEVDHMLPGAWAVQWHSEPGYDRSTCLDLTTGGMHPVESPAINPPVAVAGRIVDTVCGPESGGWCRQLTDTGHLYNWGACAPLLGPAEVAASNWQAGGRVAAHFDRSQPITPDGCVIVDTAGETYAAAKQ